VFAGTQNVQTLAPDWTLLRILGCAALHSCLDANGCVVVWNLFV
jgi:hypothetical protein